MRPTRTKIVATVGPASGSPDLIRRLIEAGVDVFRLNFSHGDHESHARYIETIRALAAEAERPVAIMQDLQGPRIRTGALPGGQAVELTPGDEVRLRAGDFEPPPPGREDTQTIPVNYERLATDVNAGDVILLSDGLIELKVLDTDGAEARCRVTVGGRLAQNQGVNLPGVKLSISAPTDKDLEDLRFGVEHEVDWVALSFVQTAGDMLRLKEEIAQCAGPEADIPVIAKIERPEAVRNLHEILRVCDAVMVARGDLGIEMATEAVPAVQKQIIRMANRLAVPAITATQMLESMIASPRPTRAEASDVANAILDGTDAVMLSGETSIGRYPVEAVRVMDRIARRTEELWREEAGSTPRPGSGRAPPEREEVGNAQQLALASAACAIADQLGAAGIVPFTLTGSTARCISQRRPAAPIYALTPNPRTYRRLALVWGVRAVRLDMFETTDEMIERGRTRLVELGLASAGDTVVYVAGPSTGTPGGADMLKIHRF